VVDTLYIDGKQLTSTYDRVKEAEIQAAQIAVGAEEAWCYGVGLGDLPRAILARGVKRLNVVTMNQGVFLHACSSGDQSDWLNSPRMHLTKPDEVKRMGVPFACVPLEVIYADPEAWHLRDRIRAVLNEPFNVFRLETLAKHKWNNNAEVNGRLGDPNVRELFKQSIEAATVCGGGPTLSEQYGRLKGVLIGATTTLIPLQRAGIYQQISVIIDESDKNVAHIEGVNTSGILVYRQSVTPAIPAAWKGPRYTMGDDELFRGGAVCHPMIDLAVQMGAKTVRLAGLDFGYPVGTKTHVDGAALPEALPGAYRAMNGHGEVIRTDESFCQARIYAEEYVALHPEVKFLKMGRGGSETRGVEWDDA
jgi:hypothetical protein